MIRNSEIIVKDYKVLALCCTYNQSNYIEDSLGGFAIQKTDFPFVCLILDDASTDGEQEVINTFLEKSCDLSKSKQYEIEEANITIAEHRTNENCIFVIYFLKKNLYGSSKKIELIDEWRKHCKYEALCEGDDYWTCPTKLQKQYEIMEAHPECTICFNRVQAISADDREVQFLIPRVGCVFNEGKVTLKDLAVEEFKLANWCFHTSGFFIKREIALELNTFKDSFLPSFPYRDMPLQMYALLQGDGYFLEETMGCYRLLSGGWNSRMVQNQEFNKRMTRKVIAGFKEFDKFTKFRYHRFVRALIIRKEFYQLYDSRSRRIRFWKINLIRDAVAVKSMLKKIFKSRLLNYN